MDLGFTAVPVVAIIIYVLAELYKASGKDAKWLPSLCMLCGGLVGALAWRVVPDYPADNIMTAIAVGIASGAAATAVNQVYKQLTQ